MSPRSRDPDAVGSWRLATSRARRWLGLPVIAAVVGCAAPPPPAPAIPAPKPPVEAVPWPDLPAPPAPAPAREFCAVLATVMESQPDGFAPLRGPALNGRRWVARESLPGAESCLVEGEGWPAGRYLCSGVPFEVAGRDAVEAEFDDMVARLDQCLAKPTWFPRAWQRGKPFQFAMGERLLTWTDRSTVPASQLVLKVHRAVSGRTYLITLDLGAAPS